MNNEFDIVTMDDDFSDTRSQAEMWGVEAKSDHSCESDTSDDTAVCVTPSDIYLFSSPRTLSTSEAIEHIEEMVLSFLTQLVLPQRADNSASSEDNCQKAHSKLKQDDKVKPKVEIMLVDRKRNTLEGYGAIVNLRRWVKIFNLQYHLLQVYPISEEIYNWKRQTPR
jgi:hypothetical protein